MALIRRGPNGVRRIRGAASEEIGGLPRWFYVVAVVSLVVALVLPFKPVKFLLAAVFGGIYANFMQKSPEKALFVFVLGMPALDLLPPNLIPIPGLNPETLVILTLAIAASKSKKQWGAAGARSNPMLGPVLFYVGVMCLSAIVSYLNGVRVWELGWHTLTAWETFSSLKNRVFYVFLAPISFVLLRKPEDFRTVMRLIAATTFLVGLHAVIDIADTLGAGLTLESNRAEGLVAGQPNLFGGWLAMVMTMLLPLLLSKSVGFRERMLYLAAMGMGGAALLFTLSRGSWLALAFALTVVALFRGARLVVFLLVVAFTAQWWLPESVVQRVQLTTAEDARSTEGQELDDSAQVRLDQWKTLPTMMAESPVWGSGYRSFEEMWARFGPKRNPKAAHSSIVELAVEEGMLGIAAYAVLILSMAATAWRLRRSEDVFLQDLSVGFLAAIAALVMLDTSGTRFRNGEVMAYVWILAGGLASQVSSARRGRRGAPAAGATPDPDPAPVRTLRRRYRRI
jgi:O-antigen ligase